MKPFVWLFEVSSHSSCARTVLPVLKYAEWKTVLGNVNFKHNNKLNEL